MKSSKFNIRVYGLLFHNSQVLLSKEMIKGKEYIKFPGGGLEFGEGVLDCLKREFIEELNLEINIKAHFHTTEDFIPSAFNPKHQGISIYYLVENAQLQNSPLIQENKKQGIKVAEDQIVYWCPIDELKDQKIDLPIDKIVVEKLIGESFSY